MPDEAAVAIAPFLFLGARPHHFDRRDLRHKSTAHDLQQTHKQNTTKGRAQSVGCAAALCGAVARPWRLRPRHGEPSTRQPRSALLAARTRRPTRSACGCACYHCYRPAGCAHCAVPNRFWVSALQQRTVCGAALCSARLCAAMAVLCNGRQCSSGLALSVERSAAMQSIRTALGEFSQQNGALLRKLAHSHTGATKGV